LGGKVLVHGQLLEFDHAALDVVSSDEILLKPTATSDVDHGKILREGVITLSDEDGWIGVRGLVVDLELQFWTAEQLRQLPGRVFRSGHFAVKVFGSLDLPDFELREVDLETGIALARQRHRVY